MPTDQPNNAPASEAPKPRDADTAATVVADERLDVMPGGGGLMGADAGAAPEGQAGASTPNSPIDAHLPHDGGEGVAEAEARSLATGEEPSERAAI